jgi:hypothetical protein
LAGMRITEVPTTLKPDGRDRPPHLRSWRDGWRHLRFLLLHAPAWLFLYPGLALLVMGLGLALVLSMGPLALGRFTLDIHTLLYASVSACVGLQMLLFAGLSSSHAVLIGVLPAMPHGLSWVHRVSLEQGLLVGLALVLAGAGLALGTVWMWSGADFQAVNPSQLMRVAIPAAALVLSGTQIGTTSFLMEFVRLTPRKDRQGG